MSDTLSPQIRFGSNAGQPATRRDGLAKVTGVATFAADNTPEGLLYAVYALQRSRGAGSAILTLPQQRRTPV